MKKIILFAALLSITQMFRAVPVSADWIQQGGWPTRPEKTPVTENDYLASREFIDNSDLPYKEWYDTYYAPGYGIELSIVNKGEGEAVYPAAYIYNYNNVDTMGGYIGNSGHIGNSMNAVSDTELQEVDGGFTITRIDEDTVQLEFEDSYFEPYAYNVYPSTTTFTLTSLQTLFDQGTEEDRWSGAYCEDTTNDYYAIISIESLYGTGDYAVVRQAMYFGEPERYYYEQLYYELEDILVHAQDGGVVSDGTLYWIFTKGEDGSIEGTDSLGESILMDPTYYGGGGIYEFMMSKPIWTAN